MLLGVQRAAGVHAAAAEAALRRAEGPRAGDHHVEPAQRARRQRAAAGEERAGTRRLRQGQSGQAQLRVGRQRQLVASQHGAAEVDRPAFDAVHVPFNGSPPAVTATIQGETQMMFAVMQPLQPQIQAGKLRALAVTTAKRFPLLPDLPTIAESGYPGLRGAGVERRARAGRHAEADRRAAQRRDQRDPEAAGRRRRRCTRAGFDLIGGTPEDFGSADHAARPRSGRR